MCGRHRGRGSRSRERDRERAKPTRTGRTCRRLGRATERQSDRETERQRDSDSDSDRQTVAFLVSMSDQATEEVEWADDDANPLPIWLEGDSLAPPCQSDFDVVAACARSPLRDPGLLLLLRRRLSLLAALSAAVPLCLSVSLSRCAQRARPAATHAQNSKAGESRWQRLRVRPWLRRRQDLHRRGEARGIRGRDRDRTRPCGRVPGGSAERAAARSRPLRLRRYDCLTSFRRPITDIASSRPLCSQPWRPACGPP